MDAATTLTTCSLDRSGVASAGQLRAAGITRSALSRAAQRGDVTRVRPGVYSCGPLAAWPIFLVTSAGVAPEFVQHVRAALLSLGDRAAAAGTTAACLRGWGLLNEPRCSLEVVVPRGRSRVRLAGVRAVQRRRVAAEEWSPYLTSCRCE